jgi:hypothetical protein
VVARQGPIVSLGLLGAIACVPATADPDPHGAVEVRVHPSPASRGEPFSTSDGWTVTVERLAVEADFVATPTAATAVHSAFTFSAAEDQSMIVVAVPAGPAVVVPLLSGRFIGGMEPMVLSDEPASHGVDAALSDRLERLADSAEAVEEPSVDAARDAGFFDFGPQGPAFILAARGTKGDKTVRFDLSVADLASPSGAPLRIAADALTPVDFTAHAEALFTSEDDGAVIFGDIAAADTDGDGVVSPAELRKTFDIHCPGCTDIERAEGAATARASGLSLPTLFGNRLAKFLGAN